MPSFIKYLLPRYATVRNLQVTYAHAGHLGVILPPSASQPLIAMKESHTSSDQQADTSFPSYLRDRFIILKFFTYVAKKEEEKTGVITILDIGCMPRTFLATISQFLKAILMRGI